MGLNREWDTSVKTIEEMPKQARFIQITGAGLRVASAFTVEIGITNYE